LMCLSINDRHHRIQVISPDRLSQGRR
jgi:hypothetical protein